MYKVTGVVASYVTLSACQYQPGDHLTIRGLGPPTSCELPFHVLIIIADILIISPLEKDRCKFLERRKRAKVVSVDKRKLIGG